MFNFIYKNIHLLSFGFLIAFSSGFGQTFFISLFSNDFRETFKLSNTEFGSIYSIATVLSAITIIWAGKLIDTVNLKKYALTIVFGMAMTCLMASLVFNIFFLFLTIYFLRLFGQGLMGHTSRTTMARYFNTNRGKALAISAFGFSIGEMVYPIVIVFLILTIGWRLTWLSSSIFIFFILGLIFYYLLRNNNFKIENNFNSEIEFQQVSWRRRDVLKDAKFYIYLPLTLLMSFIVTGFLFHQLFIADIRSWNVINLAQSFIFFAISGLIGAVI